MPGVFREDGCNLAISTLYQAWGGHLRKHSSIIPWAVQKDTCIHVLHQNLLVVNENTPNENFTLTWVLIGLVRVHLQIWLRRATGKVLLVCGKDK